ncbi:GDSL esterase/lipase At5g45950 isoform X1 [Typha angustifolia]|uniref:GDSL esterase/lipase At5g45950 isoform X1 n=1 Tax=Typha angustifolia TaxID=59011 RepID=UPI003C30ABBF
MTRLAAVIVLLMALQLCNTVVAFRRVALPSIVNRTCLLIFGDSTVDPGNNNRLPTAAKANFLPYGKDFINGRPTGRFCDGRLATDFLAERLGISKIIPAFLDPNLTPEQLIYGVSFASASSGYDELTAKNAKVIGFTKQLKNLRHYKIHLRRTVGVAEANRIVKNAVFVISAGTNDLLLGHIFSNQSTQSNSQQYENYLITNMAKYVKEMHRLGGRMFVVVSVPPMGCLPIVRTLQGVEECVENFNALATSFNSKLVKKLDALRNELQVRTYYVDIYNILDEATKNPEKFGFIETSKGCCGSGMLEVGETCKGQGTCEDPTKYVYWDAVHPTERMYEIITDQIVMNAAREILG